MLESSSREFSNGAGGATDDDATDEADGDVTDKADSCGTSKLPQSCKNNTVSSLLCSKGTYFLCFTESVRNVNTSNSFQGETYGGPLPPVFLSPFYFS